MDKLKFLLDFFNRRYLRESGTGGYLLSYNDSQMLFECGRVTNPSHVNIISGLSVSIRHCKDIYNDKIV